MLRKTPSDDDTRDVAGLPDGQAAMPPRGQRGATCTTRPWNAMLGQPLASVMAQGEADGAGLPPLLCALARAAVDVLHDADEGLHHHAPLLLAAGACPAQLVALQQLPAIAQGPWTPLQRAALALCVQMTGTAAVGNDVFEEARTAMGNDEQLFGLVGVIATQDTMARALNSAGHRVDN